MIQGSFVILGSFWCRLYGHKYGRAYDKELREGECFAIVREKQCKRCSSVAPVKRRKVKGAE